MRYAVVDPDVTAYYEAVATDYFLLFGVPYDHLSARDRLHCVELVDVAAESGATSGVAECYFAQAAYFAHGVRRVEGVYDVYEVSALVGGSQQAVVGQFVDYKLSRYFRYYFLHVWVVGRPL